MTTLYNEEATKFSRSLGGGDFKLKAAWKQRELDKKSRIMAKSLNKTFNKERDRIAGLATRSERRIARRKFVDFKSRQLDSLINQEARFQAQTDILAHSGGPNNKMVDVEKSKVMYFDNLGPRTCDFCIGIASGNPYTIRGATTLGASAHPNCWCAWTEQWRVDPDAIKNAQRQVRDGELEVWDGRRMTPAPGKASTKTKMMKERKGGWRGRRTEQKKVIYQHTGQRVTQPYPPERVFGAEPIEVDEV